ncbi:C2H2 finger domain-containing protein [Histoplasma capsulatum]|uniref:C2H2 finger domain-containing protein n=1 Tax=Ajellomyces capsulatus TaxID=5037 RepID=A0A8A1MEU8_AJECA|nr:predicted protein [Histoplasma mississippiense (nom. inval.)]EDN04623.1 predicted protein [Histoplasma mississippiense (nom. inval.)]QSS65026.1 C2H2 finger domain-containing protein [Histoplasma capsulatum]
MEAEVFYPIDLPHTRFWDLEYSSDSYSSFTNPTILAPVTALASYPDVVDTQDLRQDARVPRTAYIEKTQLPCWVKSVNDCTPISVADENPQATCGTLNIPSGESDGSASGVSPGLRWICESPGGSYGGDLTEADSSLSEQSWGHVYTSRDSQCTTSYSSFSSPLSDTFQYRDPSNCFPSTNMEGSYCGSEHSVSLREVQHYPDPDPELETKFEIGIGLDGQSFSFYPNLPASNPFPGTIKRSLANQDGQEDRGRPGEIDGGTDSPTAQIQSDQFPAAERRRPPHKRMKYSTQSPQRIPSPRKLNDSRGSVRNSACPKRTSKQGRSLKSAQSIRGYSSSQSQQKTADRQFICVFARYGCNSTFSTKNEWKRHVSSQHLQLGFYRCDVGCCNVSTLQASSSPDIPSSPSHPPRSPNDFNRKDLFTQHQRRMHSPWASSNGVSPKKPDQDAFDKSLEDVRKRCWIERRKPPRQSMCNFCCREFSGSYCWDDRMEHVGKHYENRDVETGEDVALREWALQEGILKVAGRDGWVLASPKEIAERRVEDF